ncbi:MAG: LamG domain-containing protein, partial [Gemmataceae bacterium]|nr:LamG domain-containing protein [Gemmataceae bacterium]
MQPSPNHSTTPPATLGTISNLTGGLEDTGFTITYESLAAAADEADVEGDVLSFRIEAVTSGSLTKGGVAVTPGSTRISAGETLVWTPAANANGTINAFTVKAWDGSLSSPNAIQVRVALDPVNDVPLLTPTGTLSYTEAAAAAAIQPGLTLSDVDDTQITGATITITSPVTGDTLSFTNTGTITGTFSGGVLTLSGTDTLANYQAALRAVKFSSTSTDPTANGTRLTRSITFSVTDANASNAANGQQTGTATSTINLTGTNSAPVLADTALSISVPEDGGVPSGIVGVLVSSLVGGITDADAFAVKGIAITATVETNGTWYYSTNGGNTWTVVGSVSSTNALLLAADANTRLYYNSTAANYTGTRTAALTFKAWDGTSSTAGTKVNPGTYTATGALSSATDTVDVVVTPVNDAPIVTAGSNLAYTEGTAGGSGGGALQFDGVNDYVNIPSNDALSLGTGNMTVELWTKMSLTQSGVYPNFIGCRSSTGNGFMIFASGGNLAIQIAGTNTISSTPVQDNTWHHIALVRTGNSFVGYVDGVQALTFTSSSSITGSDMTLGWDIGNPSQTYLNGFLDEVRVWNVARSLSDLTANRNGTIGGGSSGLVAYYKLDESSGAIAANSATATTGINGTLTNGPVWAPTGGAWGANAIISPSTTITDVDDTSLASGATVSITA